MKTFKFEKNSPEWFEARQGVISGTKAKEVKPPLRKVKTGSQTLGFWSLVAEHLSFGAEEESPMVRGTRLEEENAEKAIEKLKLKNAEYGIGTLWQDDNGLLGYSPDAYENVATPSWAIECKSLKTAEHIYLVARDAAARGLLPEELFPMSQIPREEYRGIDFVAEEHQMQIKQAFVVNPALEVVYYSLYDPRILVSDLQHYIITVKRSEMKDDIAVQKEMMEQQALLARKIAIAMADCFDDADN